MRKWFRFALLAVLAVLPSLGCEPGPERYYVRDKDNRIVLYHGVSVSNSSKDAPRLLPWHTKQDFARLRDWGFNLVRYLVFWEAIEPVEGQFDEAYIAATIERIRWLEELGIDVLIDVHQDLYARKFGGNGFPAWTIHDFGLPFHPHARWNVNYLEPAVMAAYLNFWSSSSLKGKYIAMLEHLLSRLDGLPNVVGLDIINEPSLGLDFDLERRFLSSFYQDVLAMRNAKHFRIGLYFEPLMFTSAGVPTRLTFQPGANCVYAPHYYDPLCHEGAPYTLWARLWMNLIVKSRVKDAQRFRTPMCFGEFGIGQNVDGYLRYLSDFLGLMDRYHISWIYYSYDKSSDEAFGVLQNPETENPQMTKLVRLYPQRIAGRNPVIRYRERCFDLSYDPVDTSAPTVVFIPRSFEGVQITFNGKPVDFDAKVHLLQVRNSGKTKQTIQIRWQSEKTS